MALLDRETKRTLRHLAGHYSIVVLILGIAVALDLFEQWCKGAGVSDFICGGITLLCRFLFVVDLIAAAGLSVLSFYHLFRNKL